jgi:hypothetical protein
LWVKAQHECTCQICGTRLVLKNGRPRADAAHIRPLAAWYQTIETTACSIIDFVLAVQSEDMPIEGLRDPPAEGAYVGDEDEAQVLGSDPGAARKWGYVALPQELYERLLARAEAPGTETEDKGKDHPT